MFLTAGLRKKKQKNNIYKQLGKFWIYNTQKVSFSPWCWPKNSSTEEDPVSRHLECLCLAHSVTCVDCSADQLTILQRDLSLVKNFNLASWPIRMYIRKANYINAGSICSEHVLCWKTFWRKFKEKRVFSSAHDQNVWTGRYVFFSCVF